jgi:flagellar basal-body rod protein FlgC
MDSLLPTEISSMSMSTQRLRLAIIASNLANAQTTRTPEGGPYRRRELVITSAAPASFQSALDRELDGAQADDSAFNRTLLRHLRGVKPVRIVTDSREPLTVHAPWHPDADENGNVQMPNISVMEEMANMITVSRSYEANLAVIKTSKNMVLQALQIGR